MAPVQLSSSYQHKLFRVSPILLNNFMDVWVRGGLHNDTSSCLLVSTQLSSRINTAFFRSVFPLFR